MKFLILISVLATVFYGANAVGAPFSTLSTLEKSWVLNNLTGGLNTITVNGMSKQKAIYDTIYGLNLGLNALSGIIQKYMTGPTQTAALAAVKSLYPPTNALNSYPDLLTLNTTYFNSLVASNVLKSIPSTLKEITSVDWTIYILRYVNLDTYTPDLTKLSDFWISFFTYASSVNPAFATKISTAYTQNQADAMAAAFVIPSTSAAQVDLFNRVITALTKRPSLPAEFLNVGWSMTNTFNQQQLSVAQTLVKDMNCYFLNRISFKDILAVYVSQGASDLDAFNRICQCNIKFVYDAMRSNLFNGPSVFRTALSSWILKYMNALGITDPVILKQYAGSFYSA